MLLAGERGEHVRPDVVCLARYPELPIKHTDITVEDPHPRMRTASLLTRGEVAVLA
jgi:hypothetical protein